MICIYCGNKEKNEEFNDEHIVNNSLGGKAKIKICKQHNSDFSDKRKNGIDLSIIDRFRAFRELVEAKIDRGVSDKQGIKIFIDNDLLHINVRESGKKISLESNKEKILLSLKDSPKKGETFFFGEGKESKSLKKNFFKKHNINDFDEVEVELNLNNPSVYFPLENKKTLRAIAKITFNFLGNIDANLCISSDFDQIRKFILNENAFSTKFCFPDYQIYNASVFGKHLINIIGLPEHNIIFAKVALFGIFTYSVLLSDTYQGRELFYVFSEDYQGNENSNPQDLLFKIFQPGNLNKEYFEYRENNFDIEYYLNPNNEKNFEQVDKIRKMSVDLRGFAMQHLIKKVFQEIYRKY